MNLEESPHALPTWVGEVVTHGVHHGATTALAVAQLRSGQDLHEVEPGFPPESSWDEIDKLVSDFTDAAEAVIASVDVVDIISNAPDGE